MAECRVEETPVSLSIQMEDNKIMKYIQSIMREIQRKLEGRQTEKSEISDIETCIKKARNTYEKLMKVLDMLRKTMQKLEEAMVEQEEVQRIIGEISSKEEKIKKKRMTIIKKKKNVEKKMESLNAEISSKEKEAESKQETIQMLKEEINIQKQQIKSKEEQIQRIEVTISKKQKDVKSKQQEIRRKLDKIKMRLQIPVTAKVLCWNINGATTEGKADIRNCLIPAVVRLVRPDVLLLQEKTAEKIVEYCKKIKTYKKKESTGSKDIVESLILYDGNKYEAIRNEDRLFSDDQSLEEVIDQSLTISIKKVVKNEHEDMKERQLKSIVKSRICYVGLKIKHIRASPIMIFISYHNICKSEDARETARVFCKLVLEIHRQTDCVVVGGADLNHQLSTCFRSELGAALIPYEVTERRSEKKKIDYFIVAPDETAEEASVEALEFIDTEESDLLHSLMSELIPKRFTTADCSEALDHDPLVCELKIYMPAEDENEETKS